MPQSSCSVLLSGNNGGDRRNAGMDRNYFDKEVVRLAMRLEKQAGCWPNGTCSGWLAAVGARPNRAARLWAKRSPCLQGSFLRVHYVDLAVPNEQRAASVRPLYCWMIWC